MLGAQMSVAIYKRGEGLTRGLGAIGQGYTLLPFAFDPIIFNFHFINF